MQQSQIDIKRSQYRTNIRRRQIEQILSDRRIKLIEQQIKQQIQNALQQLDTEQKRKNWVMQKSLELGEVPQRYWFGIIRTLSISIKAFNGDFGEWISCGIVKKLTMVLRQEYKELGLAEISACTLQDIFYYIEDRSPDLNKILEYEFILDLIELCVGMENPASSYLELINIMIHKNYSLRNMFINNGLVQVLVTKFKQFNDYNSDEVYVGLTVCYRLVRVYQENGVEYLPKGNVVAILIPILDQCLARVTRQDSIRVILKVFACLAMSAKEYILASLFNCNNLIPFLMHLLNIEGDPGNRSTSSTIIAAILSSQKTIYAQELMRRGILDSILVCSKRKNNLLQCINSMLQIISNIAVNSLEEAKNLLNHNVFGEFVISHAKETHNKKHQTAIYVLTSLASFENFQITEILIRKYNLLEILVLGLCMPTPVVSTCVEILNCLTNLVRMYSQIYTGNENKICLDLQRFYNIDNVLNALEHKNGNKKVQTYISILIGALNGEYCQK